MEETGDIVRIWHTGNPTRVQLVVNSMEMETEASLFLTGADSQFVATDELEASGPERNLVWALASKKLSLIPVWN